MISVNFKLSIPSRVWSNIYYKISVYKLQNPLNVIPHYNIYIYNTHMQVNKTTSLRSLMLEKKYILCKTHIKILYKYIDLTLASIIRQRVVNGILYQLIFKLHLCHIFDYCRHYIKTLFQQQ